MHGDRMTPHKLFLALVLSCLVAALALSGACGGGGDKKTFEPGKISDPGSVPTATPWETVPEVLILDPDDIKPLPGGPSPSPGGNGTPEPGTCGPEYTVVSGDTLFGIADKCNVDIEDLKAANPNVKPSEMHIGDKINIPQGDSTATPTPES